MGWNGLWVEVTQYFLYMGQNTPKIKKWGVFMSEIIGQGEERRQNLKQIILALHGGKSPEELKQEFMELLDTVGASEIGTLEQELINEGELSEQEIKKLCDVHAKVFEDSLQQQVQSGVPSGHPVHTFQKENRAIEKILVQIRSLLAPIVANPDLLDERTLADWQQLHRQLMEMEKHFSRKENIVFPYLEKHGVAGPSKVMWAVHDDLRDEFKEIRNWLAAPQPNSLEVAKFINDKALPNLSNVEALIFKEENIMFPMCLDKFTQAQWQAIYDQSDDIGYCLIEPDRGWQPKVEATEVAEEKANAGIPKGFLNMQTGILTLDQINMILNKLPVDITFVDAEDKVQYFSQGPERIFARTPAIIGRKVANCHPPDSVHVVEKIVNEFKSGERDSAEFWLNYNGMYVYITYHALRDEQGVYQGTLEITQNIKPLQQISGEKRILDPQ